jgi:hypothetical protein
LSIRDVVNKMTGTFYVKVEDRGYTVQVYANDRTGNIKRSDETDKYITRYGRSKIYVL